MKTQLVPNADASVQHRSDSFRETLARDSLQTIPNTARGNQMFTVLYNLILYVIAPIAFEMSFVKIFQRSMSAYSANDTTAMSRLVIYFIIQWFLGVLVRKQYLRASLKRMTLVLMILIQVKETFFDEIFLDMLVSMVMESGLMVLLFFKFANLVVLLKMVGLSWLMLGTFLALVTNRKIIRNYLNKQFHISKKNVINFMIRTHLRIILHEWRRLCWC